MDVLVCPSCSRRYAISGSAAGGGWRCTRCSAELQTMRSDVLAVDLGGGLLEPSIADGHLHPLIGPGGGSPDAAGGD